MSIKSFSNWTVLLMLNVYGGGIYHTSFLVSILASLYAGAFFQLTVALTGLPSLCIFIRLTELGQWGLNLYISIVVFTDKLLAFVNGVSEIILKFFGYIIISKSEIIVSYKIHDFRFVIICVYDYYQLWKSWLCCQLVFFWICFMVFSHFCLDIDVLLLRALLFV